MSDGQMGVRGNQLEKVNIVPTQLPMCSEQDLAELIALFRSAALHTEDGLLCVATLRTGGSSLDIVSRQQLTQSDVSRITAGLQEKAGLSEGAFAALDVSVNGLPRQQCDLDPKGETIQNQVVLPLISSGVEVGWVFFGSVTTSPPPATHLGGQPDLISSLAKMWDGLATQKEQFEAVLSHMHDGVVLVGKRQKLLFINQAAIGLLQLPAENSSDWKTLRDLQVPALTRFLEEALINNLNEVNKVISAPDDKSKLIGVHTEVVKNAQQKNAGWMILLRDVTLNWKVDQMRSSLTIASHEIKTPLNSISSTIDLLLEQDFGTLSENQIRCLNIIKDDTRRLNRLLSDILDLSRFEEGVQFIDRRKHVALTFLVNKVVDSFRGYARAKKVSLESFVPRTIPTFKGDRDRLQQVFSNLVENGIKYSLPGGRVEIHAELSNSMLTCWVKDHGVGIPQSHFETIFEKFRQLDNYPGFGDRGYGLGLSITKEIIDAIGGKIWVESRVGVGSTFYFNIPV